MSAKSWVSVKAAISATLAARGGGEGDFGCLEGCPEHAVWFSDVEILFRLVKDLVTPPVL
jgi:hypothetical protein